MKRVKILNDLMLNGKVVLKKGDESEVFAVVDGEGRLSLPALFLDGMGYSASPTDVQWIQCDNVIYVDFVAKQRINKG